MLKNGFYNVAGAIVRSGTALLTIPLTIRLIGVEEYGLWTLVSAVVAIVSLAEAGLSISTTVFVSKDLASDDLDGIFQTLTIVMGLMLVLATFGAAVLWIGSESLTMFFPKLERTQHEVVVKSLQLGAVVIWTRLIQQIFVGVEQAYQRYGVMNVLNTIQIVLSNLGLLVVAWLGGRALEMMAWQALVSSGGAIAHGWVGWSLLKFEKLDLKWNRQKAAAISHYSLMTWVTSIGSALFTQGDRLIVGSILDSKLLGVYAAITSITSQINSLSALAIQPLLPSLSSQLGKLNCDRHLLEKKIETATRINGIVALGLGALLSIFAPLVLSTMIPDGVTNEYLTGFRLATIIYSLYSVNAVGHYILFSVNAVNLSLAITLSSGIVSLVMIFFGSNYFGLLGAIAGNSGYLGVWLLNFTGMKKIGIATKQWLKLLSLLILGFFGIALISWSIKYQNSCNCWRFFEFY